MSDTYIPFVLALLVLLASLISIRLALSVAIVEIALGVVAGNLFQIESTAWIDFLAVFGGILLTFLAGVEVDTDLLRSRFKESALIGGFSFLVPFVAAFLYCYLVAGWDLKAAEIAGAALSTTSLAVVYAVLVETGLTNSDTGKVIMAACFITDLGTVVALSVLFAEVNWWTVGFYAVSAVVIVFAPRVFRWFVKRYGGRVIEPDIKLIFAALFGIMLLATLGNSHAVLPVFILGAALSKSFAGQRDLQRKLRVIAFGIVTPFFFLKGGMNVSISALATSVGLVAILFALKIAAKFVGVYPFARRYLRGHAPYATLLMSTGLTFGTISALYGLQAGHIDKTQFTVLVTVVIATAVIPTLIAQRFFQPPLPLGAAQPSQAAPTGSVADEERAGPEAAGDQEHAGVGGSVGEQTS
jgi:Kef-type K+ transport system membrane component KefB